VRSFTCGCCRQLVFFENTQCLGCGAALGVDPDRREVVTLRAATDGVLVEVDPAAAPGGRRWRRCANACLVDCNWLVPIGTGSAGPSGLCASCDLTRTRPADVDPVGISLLATAEAAKRRLVFQLGELGLPIVSRHTDGDGGLAFDLLSSGSAQVTTGHDNGLVTLNLAESDDAYREQTRHQLGEPYRTLLGHFRHEIGHYYWTSLVEGSHQVDTWRALFGDERQDYDAALKQHYESGPPRQWGEHYVSAYATMHPWEDWAETFAHYLHIRDTIQTAAAFGIVIAGPIDMRTGRRDPQLASIPIDGTLEVEGFHAVIADWLPLTYALNAVNRSMGRDDLYPFVLAPTILDKLAFVHLRVVEAGCKNEPPA
jgi:hypothetical protein